ncbi:MAG: patatin-like phospholipase family protein [Pseudomonadota bacterium]
MERVLAHHDGLLVGIDRNITAGRLNAVGITTTDYGTSQSVTWAHGEIRDPWRRPYRRSENTVLTVEHVMASAALPLIFPAVKLANGWHGDGGIRLTAPLSPALHLGANRILAISNRHGRSLEQAELPMITNYPPPAQVIGALMNAIFLDMLDYDATTMKRYNDLIATMPTHTAPYRHVDVLILRPSQDLGRLARQFESRLPSLFRFLTRGFGTTETESPDALSLLMFQSDYVTALLELGQADARARRREIQAFLGTE